MFEEAMTALDEQESEKEIRGVLTQFLYTSVRPLTVTAIKQALNEILRRYLYSGKNLVKEEDGRYYRLRSFKVSISPTDPSQVLCDPEWERLPDVCSREKE
jgi:hypothetical protein